MTRAIQELGKQTDRLVEQCIIQVEDFFLMARQSQILVLYVLTPKVEEIGYFMAKTIQAPAEELQDCSLIPQRVPG